MAQAKFILFAINNLFNKVLHNHSHSFNDFVPFIYRIGIKIFICFKMEFELLFLGECRALSHLGAVHMALQNYTHAIKCYQEQLERAQDLQDSSIEAEAFGNLGIAKLNRYARVECLLFTHLNVLNKIEICN